MLVIAAGDSPGVSGAARRRLPRRGRGRRQLGARIGGAVSDRYGNACARRPLQDLRRARRRLRSWRRLRRRGAQAALARAGRSRPRAGRHSCYGGQPGRTHERFDRPQRVGAASLVAPCAGEVRFAIRRHLVRGNARNGNGAGRSDRGRGDRRGLRCGESGRAALCARRGQGQRQPSRGRGRDRGHHQDRARVARAHDSADRRTRDGQRALFARRNAHRVSARGDAVGSEREAARRDDQLVRLVGSECARDPGRSAGGFRPRRARRAAGAGGGFDRRSAQLARTAARARRPARGVAG